MISSLLPSLNDYQDKDYLDGFVYILWLSWITEWLNHKTDHFSTCGTIVTENPGERTFSPYLINFYLYIHSTNISH